MSTIWLRVLNDSAEPRLITYDPVVWDLAQKIHELSIDYHPHFQRLVRIQRPYDHDEDEWETFSPAETYVELIEGEHLVLTLPYTDIWVEMTFHRYPTPMERRRGRARGRGKATETNHTNHTNDTFYLVPIRFGPKHVSGVVHGFDLHFSPSRPREFFVSQHWKHSTIEQALSQHIERKSQYPSAVDRAIFDELFMLWQNQFGLLT